MLRAEQQSMLGVLGASLRELEPELEQEQEQELLKHDLVQNPQLLRIVSEPMSTNWNQLEQTVLLRRDSAFFVPACNRPAWAPCWSYLSPTSSSLQWVMVRVHPSSSNALRLLFRPPRRSFPKDQ